MVSPIVLIPGCIMFIAGLALLRIAETDKEGLDIARFFGTLANLAGFLLVLAYALSPMVRT